MTYKAVFDALADDTRREIFEALRERPKSVGELASEQPVSRPAVSQHLKVLQKAKLVSVHPEGTRRIYSINRDGLLALRHYIDDYWSDVLIACQAYVSKPAGDNDA
ncbi:MAG: ArsR/SmtB family transcription factor [Granulosicoccus sp.]